MAGVVARESMVASILTYIGVGIGFLTTFFIQTAYLTTEQVGLMRILLEVATLLSGFCLLGLSTSISRYFPYFKSNPMVNRQGRFLLVHNGFLGYIIRLAVYGSLAFSLLYALAHSSLVDLFSHRSELFVKYYWFVLPLAIFIVFWTISELYSIQLLKLSIPKGIREIALRVFLLLSYLLFASQWIDFTTLVFCFVGSYGLCLFLSYLYLGRLIPLTLSRSPEFPSGTLGRDIKRYTLLALLSTVGTTLAGRMDLFMLAVIDVKGLESAAVFTIAFYMVSIIEIPTKALTSIATARLSEEMKEGDLKGTERIYRQVAFYQLLTGLIIFLMIWVNMDNIFAIMPNGEAYKGGRYAFLALAISKLVEVTFTASHPIVNASRHYHWSLYYTLWLCVVSFLSNLFLIPRLGILGAGVSTLITVVVGYGLQQGLLSFRYRVHPFSWRMIILLPITLVILLGDMLLPAFSNSLLDLCLRSILVGGCSILFLWLTGSVPEIQAFVRERRSKR